MDRVREIHSQLLQLKAEFLQQDKECVRTIRTIRQKIREMDENRDNFELEPNPVAPNQVRLKKEVVDVCVELATQLDTERDRQHACHTDYYTKYDDLMHEKLTAWGDVPGCDVRDTINYFLNKASMDCDDQWVASAPDLESLGYY